MYACMYVCVLKQAKKRVQNFISTETILVKCLCIEKHALDNHFFFIVMFVVYLVAVTGLPSCFTMACVYLCTFVRVGAL